MVTTKQIAEYYRVFIQYDESGLNVLVNNVFPRNMMRMKMFDWDNYRKEVKLGYTQEMY